MVYLLIKEKTWPSFFRCLKVCSELRIVVYLKELIELLSFRYIVAYFSTPEITFKKNFNSALCGTSDS